MPESKFQALNLTRSPRSLFWLSLLLLVLAAVVTLGMLVVPWRQTVLAHGQVAVFDPMQRPQPVDAQIKGRLLKLPVVEGQDIKKGAVIAVLEDRDSKFLDPQQQQRWKNQLRALADKAEAGESQIVALRGQSRALAEAQAAAVPAAEKKAVREGQKLEVLKQQLRIGEQDLVTARLQRQRIETLFAEGLRSKRDLELVILAEVEAETSLQKMQGEIGLTQTDIELARLERDKIAADLAEKQQKISESIAKTQGELAELREKIQKIESEASILNVRRELQRVVAPIDGRVVKLSKVGPGHMIKEGDTLATIVPHQQQLGVELYVRGLDTPLSRWVALFA